VLQLTTDNRTQIVFHTTTLYLKHGTCLIFVVIATVEVEIRKETNGTATYDTNHSLRLSILELGRVNVSLSKHVLTLWPGL
jgi:hypothetical protein